MAAVAIQFPLIASAQSDIPAVYATQCAACHGTRGEGSVNPKLGPALKGNPFVVNGGASAITNVIRKGRSGKARLYDDSYPNMPAVPTADAPALAAYLKGELQTR